MKQHQINSKKGFTIIEVVLVLAIGGLIMLMVFLALPALQRNQRDSQRTNDVNRLISALQSYQSSNRGAIPNSGSTGSGAESVIVRGHITKQASNPQYTNGSWAHFYDNYILVGSAGQTDAFTDPDGDPYGLIIQPCTPSGGTTLKQGEACVRGQRNGITFDEQSSGTAANLPTSAGNITTNPDTYGTNGDGLSDNKGHGISIVTNATCENDTAVYSSGARRVAVLYKKEGGGTICNAL